MSANDATALLLLALEGLALVVGMALLGGMLRARRWERLRRRKPKPSAFFPAFQFRAPARPSCWMAIRSVAPEAVKAALGLSRAAPCSWAEGLAGGHEFFISPRVHGWIIVTGVGLPDPGEDVDAAFLFLTALSKKLGHVQYFQARRSNRHHAWARLDDGCVTRAYAWAGETVWNQGLKTLPESELALRMPGYGEPAGSIWDAEANFLKVPQLAARWSLDPAEVKLSASQPAIGIAGESALG